MKIIILLLFCILSPVLSENTCDSNADCGADEKCMKMKQSSSGIISYGCAKFPTDVKTCEANYNGRIFGTIRKCTEKTPYPCSGSYQKVTDSSQCCSGLAFPQYDGDVCTLGCDRATACDNTDGCGASVDCPGAQKCQNSKCVDFVCGECGQPAGVDGCCGASTKGDDGICYCRQGCTNDIDCDGNADGNYCCKGKCQQSTGC